MEAESQIAYNKIVKLLSDNKIEYSTVEHEPVKTCEEASKIRGVAPESGAKSMLLKYEVTKGNYAVFY